MLSKEEVHALGDVLNYSFGKSGRNASTSVTSSLEESVLIINFATIVHFASDQALRAQVPRLVDESNKVLQSKISEIKDAFKSKTGNNLELSEISNRDNIEMVSTSSETPRKVAYYRRFCRMQIEN